MANRQHIKKVTQCRVITSEKSAIDCVMIFNVTSYDASSSNIEDLFMDPFTQIFQNDID